MPISSTTDVKEYIDREKIINKLGCNSAVDWATGEQNRRFARRCGANRQYDRRADIVRIAGKNKRESR